MAKNTVISTPSGKLRGLVLTSFEGDDYYSFKGVPYAKPPVKELRFQDPKPFESWLGIRDAIEHGPISLQYDVGVDDVVGSEDCLYLNVYSRSIEKNSRLPVLFWIHGGGFLLGSGNSEEFGPDFFVQKNVILVTINYRLGVFGFLNLDHELATGNQGLKDQIMALQWVKSHIESFGGDPNNVTIFGGSAGASSVHLLSTSPLTRNKGLFHKAICQSSCAYNPWVIKNKPKKIIPKFLKSYGQQENDPKKIFDLFKTADCRKLMEAQNETTTAYEWLNLNFPFGPSVDDKSTTPFMPVDVSLGKNGTIHVPLMLGYNSFEGMIKLPWLENLTIEEIDRNMENYLSYQLQDFLKTYNLTVEDLRKLYMDNENVSKHNLEKFLHLSGDIAFVEATHRLARVQVENSSAQTYFYILSFDKNKTPFKIVNKISMKGVSHGDELLYLFKMQVHEALNIKQFQNENAEKVMKQMIEMWVNFAKTGRPTPSTSDLIPSHWKPLNSGSVLRYFDIGDELHMKKMLNLDQHYSFKQ